MALIFRREFPTGAVAESAYGWISFIALDTRQGEGRLVLNIHPTADDWRCVPAEQVSIALGSPIPTLAQFMADPDFAAAFQVIATKLYGAIVEHHPDFREAVET